MRRLCTGLIPVYKHCAGRWRRWGVIREREREQQTPDHQPSILAAANDPGPKFTDIVLRFILGYVIRSS